MKLRNLIMFFLLCLFFIPHCSYALEYKKGDIRNPVITVSSDGVSVRKEVSKTDKEGVYNVKFTIEGDNVLDTISNDLYISVIFDRSGSMLCEDGTNTFLFLGYLNKATINNQNLYCMYDNEIKIDKWNNAVNGAIDFSEYIVENIPTANIKLYTFSDDVASKDWQKTNFIEADFSYPYGSTNLHLAVDAAKEDFDSISNDALKYMLIISDGQPDDLELLKKSISSAKEAGIKIYTIGYEVTENAQKVLKDISSGKDYYYNADISEISSTFKNLAYIIQEKPMGTSGILKDTIGDSFTLKDGVDIVHNNGVVNYDNFDISKKKVTFDFNISLKDNLKTGWYKTNNVLNDGVVLEYKDKSLNLKKIVIDSSSEVYWEEEKYLYTINYYKDSVDDSNFLGKIEAFKELDSIVSSDDIEIDKYIIEGYSSSNISISDYIIKKDNNIIDIVYTKEVYPYHVEYYKDEISQINLIAKSKSFDREYSLVLTKEIIEKDLGKDFLNQYRPLGYSNGNLIEEIKINLESNVVKVLYTKRNDLSYRIEYYFDGKLDKSKTSTIKEQIFGSNIDNITFSVYDNYELKEVDNYPLVISDNENNNVIKVYYTIKEGVVLPPKTLVLPLTKDHNIFFNIVFIICCVFSLFILKKHLFLNKCKR